MGYRIVYGPDSHRDIRRYGTSGIRALTAICFGIFVFLVRLVWPEGREILITYLLPGQQTLHQTAFSGFVDNLRQGTGMVDAFTVFCREVLYEIA